MISSSGSVLVFILGFLSNAYTKVNYFNYSGHDLMLTKDLTFTEFYLLNNTEVYSVNETNINSTYFPKCCPPEYQYDTVDRKCVKSNATFIYEMLSLDVNLIKSGLKDCEVIVDRTVTLNESKTLIGNDGMLKYGNEYFPIGKYCIDSILGQQTEVILRLCYGSEYCTRKDGLRCLKKCCPDGELYLGRTCGLQPEYGYPIEPHIEVISNLTENFAIFHQTKTCRLHLPNISNENVIISHDGSFNIRTHHVWKSYLPNEEYYCFEVVLDVSVSPSLLMCINTNDRNRIKFAFSRIIMPISSVCFLVTMAIYAILYKLKKIIHFVVFCYCLAQLIGFAALTYVQIYPAQTDYCKGLAFTVMFGFLAGFTWLNVMCYDMWRTLGSMQSQCGDKKKEYRKKMLYYSTYAWITPIAIILLCYLENTYSVLPSCLHAHIGESYCILERKIEYGNYGHTLFFILPIALVTISNIIFFTLTLRYIIEATDNIRHMSNSKRGSQRKHLFALKKKTFMALKLFLIMGINWTFEIISSIFDFKSNAVTKTIEIIIDSFNCFQGLFVLLIFVLKWNVLKSLMMRFKVVISKSISQLTIKSSPSCR